MAGTVTFIEYSSGTLGASPGKVIDASTVTGFVGGSLALNTDNFLSGTQSISEKVSAATVTSYGLTTAVNGEPWAFSSGGSDDGNHIYMIAQIQGSADTLANGGFGIVVADDLATDSVGTWYVGPQAGSLAGWEYFVVNPSAAFDTVTAGSGSWTTGGNPSQLSGVDGVGVRWKVTNTIMGASDNAFLQVMSIGVGYRVTGTGCTFADYSSYEVTNRFGALQTKSGVLFPLGKLRVGIESGAGNTDFTDSNFTVIWQGQTLSNGTSSAVAAGLYELSVVKGSGTTTLTLSNGTLAAASPAVFALKLNGATTVTITNINVDRAQQGVTLDDNVSWTNGQVTNSGTVDCGSGTAGPTFTGVSVLTSSVAADASALKWNATGDPDGNLDNCKFSKGTNAHHAIELGTSSPTTVTLRGMTFTGFNASNSQNDSVLLVSRTTGTVTVNVVNCTGTVSYKSAGATVNIVNNPVTFSVHVQDASTGSAISGARVLAKVASSAGGWPYNAGVSTLTRSGTTATLTASAAHGLSTNDYVVVAGANEAQYNGVFQITVTSTTAFTYTMVSDPGGSATGTVTFTLAVISGTTDGSGDISASRTYSASQPVTGWARKAVSPYYKTAPLSATISNTTGGSATLQLIRDS